MEKLKKDYYRIDEVAESWGLSEEDILDYAEQGQLNITVFLEGRRFRLITSSCLGMVEDAVVARYCELDDTDIRTYVQGGCGDQFTIYHGVHPIEANIMCPDGVNDEDIIVAKPVEPFDVPIRALLISDKEKRSFEKKQQEIRQREGQVETQARSKEKSQAGKKGKAAQDIGKFRQYELMAQDICEEAVRLEVESYNATASKLLEAVKEYGIEPYMKWSFNAVHGKVREKLRKQDREDLCTKGRPKKIEGVSKEKFTALQKQARQNNK